MNKKYWPMICVLFTSLSSHAMEISTFKIAGTTDRFYGFVQAWSIDNGDFASATHSYRLRRAELHFDSVFSDRLGSFLAIDPAKFAQNSSIHVPMGQLFVDVGLKVSTQISGLEMKVGQFKMPTTAEGLDSANDLPLPERSLAGRTYGDLHFLGAQVSYKTPNYKTTSMITSNQNVTGNTPLKVTNLVSRFEIYPIQDLSVGTFLFLGNFSYTDTGRWGANARYKIKNSDLRTEYVQSREGGVQSHGMTVEGGYWITESLEPVARYELFSPNQSWGSPGQAETVGLNYFIMKPNAKIQLAGSSLQNMTATNGSPTVLNGSNSKVMTLGFQAQI